MFSTLASVDVYRDAVNTLINQHIAVADWVRNNLPHDVRVGVHDAGVIRYYGGHPTYDLIGLTTAEGAIPWRHGSGSVFELMEQSQMRPGYLAIYPDVFSIPYLAMTDIFTEELFRTEVPDYAVTSAGPVQGVWRADWTLADSGAKFYQPDILSRMKGLTLVDTLDVADLDDEAAHQVEWWHDARRPGFPTEVQQMSYRVSPEQVVLDGGRLLTGGIAFDVVTNPGEPLWLIARLHAHEAGAVEVKVNGHTLGMWRYPPVPGQWLETAYHVPATMITAQETHVQLSADGDYPGFLHYAPYSYWFLQGEPDNAQPQIAHHVAASFGEDINLMGFDLTKQVWHPGDIVPVTCYWTTVASTPSDAKVFLHLYNTEGNLGPQSDGWAFYGTRAPYTWTPNETVADPRLLALPADMEPGIYSIEVGLYLPDEATRLTAYLNGDRQHKDRVQLVTIEVEE